MQATAAARTETKTRILMSGFSNGEAAFYNKFAERRCYPCGSPMHKAIGDSIQEIVLVPKPEVQFHDCKYSTSDPEIARGMIDNDNFGYDWGWVLDDTALPEEVRGLFGSIPIESRKAVALGAVDGLTGPELRRLISEEDLASAAEVNPGSTGWVVQCPHQGCGLEIKGDIQRGKMTQDAARKMMETHINSAHGNQKIAK